MGNEPLVVSHQDESTALRINGYSPPLTCLKKEEATPHPFENRGGPRWPDDKGLVAVMVWST